MALFSIVVTIILLIYSPPNLIYANIDQNLDPYTKDLIQNICNQTRNSETCESIFMHKLPKPKKLDHEGFTWVSIDALLKALYENIEFLQREKKKMMAKDYYSIIVNYVVATWDIFYGCEMRYQEIIKRIELIKNNARFGKSSMVQIGEMFGKFHEYAYDKIEKCEKEVHNKGLSNLFMDDLGLLQKIDEKNGNIKELIEMVVGAGKSFANIMVMGAEETKAS